MLLISFLLEPCVMFLFCCSTVLSQSMSHPILNLVNQHNLDPITKNFLRTSAGQEMFDIELPPHSTPTPEGQHQKQGESQALGASSMYSNTASGHLNNANNPWPTSDMRTRPTDLLTAWSEAQQQGNNLGQVEIEGPNEGKGQGSFNRPVYYELPPTRAGYVDSGTGQRWQTFTSSVPYQVRSGEGAYPAPNGFLLPAGQIMYASNAGPPPGRAFHLSPSGPINYQTQDNLQPFYQTARRPMEFYPGQGYHLTQRPAPGHYQGAGYPDTYPYHSNVPVWGASMYPHRNIRESSQSSGNDQMNTPSGKTTYQQPQRNSQPQTTASPMIDPPLPNSMPENNPMVSHTSTSADERHKIESFSQDKYRKSSRRRNRPVSSRQDNIPERNEINMPSGSPRNTRVRSSMSDTNQRSDNMSPFINQVDLNGRNAQMSEDQARNIAPFKSSHEPHPRPFTPPMLTLERNHLEPYYNQQPYGMSHSNVPNQPLYYHPTPMQGNVPTDFIYHGNPHYSQPHMSSFAAPMSRSNQDFLRPGQVIVQKSVPTPFMLDRLLAMVGFEAKELV